METSICCSAASFSSAARNNSACLSEASVAALETAGLVSAGISLVPADGLFPSLTFGAVPGRVLGGHGGLTEAEVGRVARSLAVSGRLWVEPTAEDGRDPPNGVGESRAESGPEGVGVERAETIDRAV